MEQPSTLLHNNLTKPIVWVHGDCLSPYNPVLQKYPDAPAIWVWDEALIKEWQLSLKRLTFIYECLLELPVVIRRGDVTQEILAFAKEHDGDLVVTADSPSPRFDEICNQMEVSITVEVLKVEAFFDYDGYIDLKRFSRYWKVAQDYVFE